MALNSGWAHDGSDFSSFTGGRPPEWIRAAVAELIVAWAVESLLRAAEESA